MSVGERARIEYTQHPNLGYVTYADGLHVGSVQKVGRVWMARIDYKQQPTPWPTRDAAARELHRISHEGN